MDDIQGSLTLLLGGGLILMAGAVCLVLGALVRAALGGGIDRLDPMPPGLVRHAAEVATRIRAHHHARGRDAALRPTSRAI